MTVERKKKKLSDECLQTVDGADGELKDLLSNNKLKKFVCNKNLDKLTMLDLSDNKITSFPRIKAKNLSDIRWSQN